MVATVNLAEELLAMGHRYRDEGRTAEAREVFIRLLDLRSLPQRLAEQAQRSLAELYLDEGNYGKARRAMSAALAANPGQAEYHFLMARALDWDEAGDEERALEHYEQAARLEPDNALYISTYGLLLALVCDPEEGMRLMEQALERERDDPRLVQNYITGLIHLDRLDDAERELRQAVVRFPSDLVLQRMRQEFGLARSAGRKNVLRIDGAHAGQRSRHRPLPGGRETQYIVRYHERPTAEAPLPLVRKSRERQENKAIALDTNLSAALEKTPDHVVEAISGALGVSERGGIRGRRRAIEKMLTNRERLRETLRGLPEASRECLTYVMARGGWCTLKSIASRFGEAEDEGRWWGEQPPRSCLGQMCVHGLAYVGRARARGRHENVVVIPVELRAVVAEALGQPPKARTPTKRKP